MTKNLAGKTAIVTGSTSGIGEAIALALAAEGVRVVVTGRDAARGSAVVDAILAAGGAAHFVPSDLASSPENIRQFAMDAAASLDSRVDILVNNAGIYPVDQTVSLPDAQLDALLAVNIRAPHVLVAALAPAMLERGQGVIVNVGSWMASIGNPFGALYSATKAAEEQLTRSWAAEFGQSGIRVNTVAPGATLTPGNEDSRAVLDAMTAATPAGSVVLPADIASAVIFLASDDARMIHGALLPVDGGISATRAL